MQILTMLFQGFHGLIALFSLPLFSSAFLSLSGFPAALSLCILLLCSPIYCMLSWTLQKILVGMVKFSRLNLCFSVFLVFTPPTHCSMGKGSICVTVWVEVCACIPTAWTRVICVWVELYIVQLE